MNAHSLSYNFFFVQWLRCWVVILFTIDPSDGNDFDDQLLLFWWWCLRFIRLVN